MRVEITPNAFDPHSELKQFEHKSGDAGALVSFVGYCRDYANGERVEGLDLHHYPGLTEKEIGRIAAEIAAKHELLDCVVIHRVGAIAAGAPIVLVAALSAHRAAAFKAVEELMDFLKTDAPIWKREISAHGRRWIDPTETDQARRAAIKEQL